MELMYFIWSYKRNKWCSGFPGSYTNNLNEAGVYGEKEAIQIVNSANIDDEELRMLLL